jgi:hypothetical protein
MNYTTRVGCANNTAPLDYEELLLPDHVYI